LNDDDDNGCGFHQCLYDVVHNVAASKLARFSSVRENDWAFRSANQNLLQQQQKERKS